MYPPATLNDDSLKKEESGKKTVLGKKAQGHDPGYAKTSIMLTRMRVSHREVRLTGMGIPSHPGCLPASRENRKSDVTYIEAMSHRLISGSPPGVPPPDIFPSKSRSPRTRLSG